MSVDARIIAATNRDLEAEVAEGRFRADLYHRLNVICIQVPRLSERSEDIPIIAGEVIAELVAEMDLSYIPHLDQAAIEKLQTRQWSGNVRELRNLIERSLILSNGENLNIATLDLTEPGKDWVYGLRFPRNRTLNQVMAEVKGALISEALRRSGGKRQDAARLLGISRNALFHHMKVLGLDA